MFGEWSAAWSGSAAAALLLQGAGFGQRADSFFLERAGSNAAEETKRKRRSHEKES